MGPVSQKLIYCGLFKALELFLGAKFHPMQQKCALKCSTMTLGSSLTISSTSILADVELNDFLLLNNELITLQVLHGLLLYLSNTL